MSFPFLIILILVGTNLEVFSEMVLKTFLRVYVDILKKSGGEDKLTCNYDMTKLPHVPYPHWNLSVTLEVNASQHLSYVPFKTYIRCFLETAKSSDKATTHTKAQTPPRQEITARWKYSAYYITKVTCQSMEEGFDIEALYGPTVKVVYELHKNQMTPAILQAMQSFTEFVCEAAPAQP